MRSARRMKARLEPRSAPWPRRSQRQDADPRIRAGALETATEYNHGWFREVSGHIWVHTPGSGLMALACADRIRCQDPRPAGHLGWIGLKSAVHHAGMEPFHGAARGGHAQEGQDGVNQRRQPGPKQRASKAQGNTHMFDIGFPTDAGWSVNKFLNRMRVSRCSWYVAKRWTPGRILGSPSRARW